MLKWPDRWYYLSLLYNIYMKSYNLVMVVNIPLIFEHSSPLNSQFSKVASTLSPDPWNSEKNIQGPDANFETYLQK